MIGLLKKVFGKKNSEPAIHSTKKGDLTEWEKKHIARYRTCPDCEGLLAKGPEGGCAMNVMCGDCYAEFNVTLFGEFCVGERLYDKGDIQWDRLKFYNLEEVKP